MPLTTAGPAGSALAFRLASTKAAPSVLLLEAGKAKDPANADILAERFTAFFTFPDSNWNYKTIPQQSCDDRNIGYARGKVLGGSTAINMCAYTVGPRDDYEKWAEMVGDEAFNWTNAVKMRKMIEAYDDDLSPEHRKYAQPDMSTHGTDGRLPICIPKVWESPMTIQLDAAKQSALGFSFDINSGNPLGLASVPSTAKDGRRVTAVGAYLESPPSNLTIMTERQVSKVILEQNRAVGIMTMQGEECQMLQISSICQVRDWLMHCEHRPSDKRSRSLSRSCRYAQDLDAIGHRRPDRAILAQD